MAFTRSQRSVARYETPGELYRYLPRRPGAVPGLWAHQSEMLKAYIDKVKYSDVALELPTGTGKTLVGLLIAEWNRLNKNERVLYACPTRQLAEQVHAAAYREGIDTSLLIGSHNDWDTRYRVQYESAKQIAVTTYNSIFNSSPKLADPAIILFDDAHAGEQYVGEAYSIHFGRQNDAEKYLELLKIMEPALDDSFLRRVRSPRADSTIGGEVRMVLPLRQPGMPDALDGFLSSLEAPYSYRHAMLRAGFSSCLAYVAYSGVLIRPYIPPTHNNSLFRGARQRIYLSATLGEGGELERAFGKFGICRLEQPDRSTAPRYGRRFFVFPEFVSGADASALSRDIVMAAGKALVLAQRTDVAMANARKLAQENWPILGVDDVRRGMEPFIEKKHAVCGLAARYDGLDLPGQACRLIVLHGKPDRMNLQEHFLQSNAQAGAVLDARVRTRIVQGAGRCTRGPKDTAIIMVEDDLSTYLIRPEVISALDPELQAEIRFGSENSQDGTYADMIENVRCFLDQDQDDTWRDQAEPQLAEYRRDATQMSRDATSCLAKCVDKEIKAWAAATSRSWQDAARCAHEVVNIVGSGGRSAKQYQAFWKYLEAAWTDMAAEESADEIGKAAARGLVDDAVRLAGMCSWVRQMAPFPEMDATAMSPVDSTAVNAIVAVLQGKLKENAQHVKLDKMATALQKRDPGQFEPALSVLGKMLGAEASKPLNPGRCDSTWCWDNRLWLALEAKSDHEPSGTVPQKDIRQANGQLKLLSEDRSCPTIPPNSATIIISPKPAVNHDGITIANEHVYLVNPGVIRRIAADTISAWKDLLKGREHRDAAALRVFVSRIFQDRGLLPSNIHARLTQNPIR